MCAKAKRRPNSRKMTSGATAARDHSRRPKPPELPAPLATPAARAMANITTVDKSRPCQGHAGQLRTGTALHARAVNCVGGHDQRL